MLLLLFLFPLLLLAWLDLFCCLLHRHSAQGTLHRCEGHVRQRELPHLSGILGLGNILENRLGDQLLQVLFHSLHHRLLLLLIILVPVFAWKHKRCNQLTFNISCKKLLQDA